MKKKIILVSLLLAGSFCANAQVEKSKTVTITADLQTSMQFNMPGGGSPNIDFEFRTINNFKKGLGGYLNSNYAFYGQIESTANWKLIMQAKTNFTHSDGATTMKLDNLGVTVEWRGKNKVYNKAKKRPLAVSKSSVLLLDQYRGRTNAGTKKDNEFNVFFEMGTRRGNMNQKSLYQQNLKKGKYQVEVDFITVENIR
ncbi:hypothetical protein EMN47_19985 [Prolixibacteraceae bacterium JC049]|nr:hypothetical protein [Prolixibacteraceae bacterium JC049]